MKSNRGLNRRHRLLGESLAKAAGLRGAQAGSAARNENLAAAFTEAVREHQAGRLAKAVALYGRALDLSSDASDLGAVYCNLGHALLLLHRRQESLAACECALALLPGSVEALANYGNVLLELGKVEAARVAYESALQLDPAWTPAINNLGTVLLEEGRLDAAVAAYERALALNPEFADARLNRGIVRLLRGDFGEGWIDYEARLALRPSALEATVQGRPPDEIPQWRGEPLNGASILLYAEQGLGDAIQFLRYVPQVASMGANVTLALPSRLLRLAKGFGDGVQVVAQEASQAAARNRLYEWQCPLMSLPLAQGFGLGRDVGIPAEVPYLTVPDDELRRAESLDWPAGAMRVGLVWAGTPDHRRDWARSIPLEMLGPLLTVPGVQFYSLQAGQAARHLDELRKDSGEAWRERILNLAPLEEDMADAAAKMMQMDLVIAVDTAMAHLAGALGRQVWLLLPAVPDWRWQLEREDSPWYPTMRLFRQPRRHAWEPVIERVREELASTAQRYQRLTPPDAATPDPAGAWTQLHAVADARAQSCKICRGRSPLFGVVDFHKSCMEGQGRRLALSGVPVYYRRCERCGFLYTEFFDAWPEAAFAERIYNADYLQVDPDAAERRPANNAGLVAEAFAGMRESISILDYGGGSGRLAELLRERGFNAATYDLFSQHREKPQGRYDLITCFEVLEHLPNPKAMLTAMAALLKTPEEDGSDGMILFSTLLQPENIVETGVSWWYAGPRNGHCSLYTAQALAVLFGAAGLQVASSNAALHLAYRRVPGFAAHLRIGSEPHGRVA
jgi:tetratricopeptide (TPR) repeat protein